MGFVIIRVVSVDGVSKSPSALAELHQAMDGCRLCLDAGHDVYPRAIYSGGLGAQIMIIGQAPGITEKDAGRPFNAGSGQRLFQWLEGAGIEEDWFRRTQYMTSVTKCYPGRAAGGSGDRVPSRDEQRLCRPYLDGELRLLVPKLVLPVGRLAISLFYPKSEPLTRIIGTQKRVDGRSIVPLPHPSGASRWHQSDQNRALIQKAVDLIAGHMDSIRRSP